jgi:transcription elongation factor GreA
VEEAPVVLSNEGIKKLTEELKELYEAQQNELNFSKIEEGISSEERDFILERIQVIEEMLKEAEPLPSGNTSEQVIKIGSFVTVLDVNLDQVVKYRIVHKVEADPLQNKISSESPVGKALLSKQAGDIVEVSLPLGVLTYEIVNVEIVSN